MTVVAILIYYALAIGLIGGVAYLTARSNVRRSREFVDAALARMHEKFPPLPPLEPYVRQPLPEPPPPSELRITIARHPESDGDRLPHLAAEVIRQVSRLEESFGGEGLEYDPKGSIDEPGRLVLRLVPRSEDWHATDRLEAVAEELNRLAAQAKQGAIAKDAADIRAQIDRELQPHLPPGVVRAEVATVS